MPGPFAYFDSPDARFDQNLRYAPASVEPAGANRTSTMSSLALNISSLSIPQRLIKGQEYITMGTSNPDVPGNGPALAVLTTAQADLQAAHAAYEEARQKCKELLALRDVALDNWNAAAMALGILTESVTGGDAAKILSAGFDVKSTPQPPQPVQQILNVRVQFNGTPGHSEVRWKRDSRAEAYVVECCQDPITESGWKNMGTVTEPRYSGNGAIPGKACWYRVAGVNRLGQGVWSEPALRPVM
jgi:hypothetical protein